MPKRKTYTGKEIAALLNRKPNTISVIANRHGIGTKLTEKFRIFTEEDLAKLRAITDETDKKMGSDTPTAPPGVPDPQPSH